MDIRNYNKEELEFLSEVLAHGIIETTMDCLNAENVGKKLCKNCPRKRVCDDVKKVFDMTI